MAVCPTCGTSYPATVRLCPADGAVLDAGPQDDPRIGTLLAGKFQVEARIGRGGMGTIYRATHVMLGRPVALKLINPDLEVSADVATRFQREARAASQLHHPNVAGVYDLGQLEDGTLYIAMELVEGETLKAVIARDGRIVPDRIVRLFGQIASALSAAHARGIIHRDLKPQNIMVTTDPDGAEVVKLLDFGIAKTVDGSATQLTSTGLSLGTPHYMAPEQAGGRPVDARSDIYALGVILYEMLTGQVPFDDPSTPAVLVKHMTEVPVRPSARRPDLALPPALEAVALRCLEKDPAARFQTADELGRAIASTGSGDLTVPTPVPMVRDTRHKKLPGAEHAEAEPPGDLAGTGPLLPPKSALQNLTSVGSSGLHAPAPVAPAEAQPSSGNAVVLVVLVLLLVGGVGFAAYGLGYFSNTDRESVASAEQQASPVAAPSADEQVGMRPDAAAPGRSGTEAPVRPDPPPSNLPPATPPAATQRRVESPGQVETGPPGAAPQAQQAAVPEPAPEPPRPEHPSVRFGCDGSSSVCAAIQSALDAELGRASMPSVADETAAEILVDALVAEGPSRVEQSFGTTFVIQPYTVTLATTARRSHERVPMPEPRSFSLDERVGQARLTEQARLIAMSIVERVRAFWNR